MPRQTKPRTARRRLQGKRVLSFVATFNIEGTDAVPVTTARHFARTNKIAAPAVIHVRRNSHTTDSFFLSDKGMFGLPYAEFNWMLFSCLTQVVKNIGEHELFDDIAYQDWSSEEESYRCEYAFI